MNNKRSSNVTGIILCGGKSIRYGRVKALETIEGYRLIDRVILRVSQLTNDIIIVTSQEQYETVKKTDLGGQSVKIIEDVFPGKAAMGGIYTGLINSNSNYSIVVACDMPFLNVKLLEYMVNVAQDYDSVVLKINNYLEPLHAVYSKSCIPSLEKLINDNQLSLNKLFELINTRYINEAEIKDYDPSYRSIFNINTHNDLEIAIDIAKRETG